MLREIKSRLYPFKDFLISVDESEIIISSLRLPSAIKTASKNVMIIIQWLTGTLDDVAPANTLKTKPVAMQNMSMIAMFFK